MKLVSIFVFILLKICYGSEEKETELSSLIEQQQAIAQVRSATLECKMEKFGTEQDVQDVTNHKTATTYQGACFRMCIAKKMNMMDSNGNPNKEEFLKAIAIFSGKNPRELRIGKEVIEELMLQPCSPDPCIRGAFWDSYLRMRAEQEKIKLFYTWEKCKVTK